MDSSSIRRTPTKRTKTKKKPIKVVYISNPMKVKASASEFRALVQELTGQDAESPPDLSRFQDSCSDDGDGGSGGDSRHQTDSDNSGTKIFGNENEDSITIQLPHVGPSNDSMQGQYGSSIEALDDVFTPQMMEHISAFLPASVFYESGQVEEVQMLRRLDAV